MASATGTYMATEADLTSVADKIRAKVSDLANTDKISFPSAFISNIDKLTDTRDANAAAGQILSGKTAYVNKSKITGTIPSKSSSDVAVSGNSVTVPSGYYSSQVSKTVGTAKAAATIYPGTSDQSIGAGYYLSGAQTFKRVTTSNIAAANIKAGVVVKVGDDANTGRILSVTGTFTNDANAPANKIISGYSAYVNGSKITGTCTPTVNYGATTTSTLPSSNKTIDASEWLEIGTVSAGPKNKVAVSYSGGTSNFTFSYRYDDGQTWHIYAMNKTDKSQSLSKNTVTVSVQAFVPGY